MVKKVGTVPHLHESLLKESDKVNPRKINTKCTYMYCRGKEQGAVKESNRGPSLEKGSRRAVTPELRPA